MANLRRYTLPMVLAIIALALLVVGILALTVWKPQQEVVAERSSQQPFTMTREGVLPLYADEVVVRATTEGNQRVWLAVGSPEDVNAWLQGESYDEIVGLSTLTELKAIPHIADTPTADPEAEADAEEEPIEDEGDEVAEDAEGAEEVSESNPISSDMWTAVKYGTGSVTLVLSGDELQDSILAATDGEGPAPTIQLTWSTPQPNVLAVAAFVLAGVFAFLTIATWAVLFAARNRRLARSLELETISEQYMSETAVMAALPATPADDAEADEAEKTSEPEETEDVQEVVSADDLEPESEQEPQGEELAAVEDALLDEAVAEDAMGEDAVAEDIVVSAEVIDENPGDVGAEEAELEPDPDAEPEADTEIEGVEAFEVEEDDEAQPGESAGDEQVETVSTDSGMLNLAALQGGGAFPTRRALREAQTRGIDALVVEGRRFSTEQPSAPTTKSGEDATPEDVLRKRSLSGLSWSQLMRKSSSRKQNGTR